MRKKILFLGLLSTAMCTYAQDSLSILKPSIGTPDKQASGNNIRNVSLHTSLRSSTDSASDTIEYTSYPQNNYSGLNSLRERLSNSPSGETSPYQTGWFGQPDTLATTSDTLSSLIGTPILFFFQIGTSNLTDTSQLANLDAIATVCRKFNLLPKVTGYADSATGNVTGNSALSKERARYIAAELSKRGIEEKSITSKGEGGIATYSPNEVNRCVKVEIYKKSNAEK